VALTLGFLRAERSDESALDPEYRPNRIHRVATGLDLGVHADIRLVRRHGEAVASRFPAWIAGSSPAMTIEKPSARNIQPSVRTGHAIASCQSRMVGIE
jgi:hypothetical protein